MTTVNQQIRFCTSSGGVRIAIATAGEGPPLVRVNNWFTHLELDWDNPVWRHWSEALVEKRMLVRYDPRGSGLSDRDTTDFSLDAMVSDLDSVVDALKLRRFAIIGLCQGGVIAVAYAARHPERVSRLVLYDSYLHGAFAGDAGEKLARQARMFSQLIEHGWGRRTGAFREVFAKLLMPDAAGHQQKWIGELQQRSAAATTACLRGMPSMPSTFELKRPRSPRQPWSFMFAETPWSLSRPAGVSPHRFPMHASCRSTGRTTS